MYFYVVHTKKSLYGEKGLEMPLNSLPNDKIFDFSKLKVFAEDNMNVAKLKFALARLENIEKMLVTSIFFFSNIFKRLLFQGHLSRDCVVKSLSFPTQY